MVKIYEAEDDYVKIGNVVLPRTMTSTDYDGMNYDTIAKRTKAKYDDEKRKEADAKRKAELRAQAQPKLDEVQEIIDKGEEPIVAMFQVFVPASGKADTVGGEIVRAANKLGYRWFNDGDFFFSGYGLETCGSCATYISDAIDFWDKFNHVAEVSKSYYDIDEDAYEKALNSVIEDVANYLLDHTELFATPNTKDCLSCPVDEWEDNYDSFDWDCQLPDNVRYHIDNGDISERDVEQEIGWWYSFSRDADIYINGSEYIQFEGISGDLMNELEHSLYSNLESYGNDLDEEYGSEWDEDEDEDEEEYEED